MFRLSRRWALPFLAPRRRPEPAVSLTPPAYHILRSKERTIERFERYSHEEMQLIDPEYQIFGCADLVGGRRHYSRPSHYTGDFNKQFLNAYRSNLDFNFAFDQYVSRQDKFDFDQVFHSLVGSLAGEEEMEEFVLDMYLAVSLLLDIVEHGQRHRVSEISLGILLVAATHVADKMNDIAPCISVWKVCQDVAFPLTQTLQFLAYKALLTIGKSQDLKKVKNDTIGLEEELSKLELGPTCMKVFSDLQKTPVKVAAGGKSF